MRRAGLKKITYTILIISILILFFSGGGLFVTIAEEHVQPITSTVIKLGVVASVALICSLLCSRSLVGRDKCTEETSVTFADQRRHFVFSLIYFIFMVTITLVLLNAAAYFFAASWPLSGLHGVSPRIGKKAWLYHGKTADFIEANSWGQRDREHTIAPKSGTYRMIFIGDSFLENGAPVPLPYRMEDSFRRRGVSDVEMINLGVSATDPDEYFFRLKRIGLPLQPDHCVMLVYAGNDFIQGPTLLSYWGISATYPRWSFLQILGLNSLDQVISNERRQVLRAWFKGGPLLEHELELQGIFGRTVSDDETEKEYLSFFQPEEQVQMKAVLYRATAEERSLFYEMLRHPDGAIFRSYFLDLATKAARGQSGPAVVPVEYSFSWVKAASELCRMKGVRFTLAVIPEGFTVDRRMSGHYAALADMNAYMTHRDAATTRFITLATEAGMDVIDLRELLKGKSGAYLDMDGHWSQYGVDLVSAFLVERFSTQARLRSAGTGGGK